MPKVLIASDSPYDLREQIARHVPDIEQFTDAANLIAVGQAISPAPKLVIVKFPLQSLKPIAFVRAFRAIDHFKLTTLMLIVESPVEAAEVCREVGHEQRGIAAVYCLDAFTSLMPEPVLAALNA